MATVAFFEPKADITVSELAAILKIIIAGMNRDIDTPMLAFPGGADNSQFKSFLERGEGVTRHFEIVYDVEL